VSSTLKCSECESHPCEKVGTACYNAIRGDGFDAGRRKTLNEAYEQLEMACWHKTTWAIIEDVFKELREQGEQK